MNRSLLLFSAVLLGGVGGVAGYWAGIPKTPKALFEKRCSNCHELPDLSGYKRQEMAPLVNFMRTHNGAARVISDEEAVIIISYLESTKVEEGQETGGGGSPAERPAY